MSRRGSAETLPLQAGSQEALAPVLTHSCWLLLFSVAVKGVPGEDWDRTCQGTRKAGCVAVVINKCGDSHSPVTSKAD